MTKLLTYIAMFYLFAAPAFATQYELAWDDGVHCGYYWGPGYYTATTFTAPYDLEMVAFKVFWDCCSSSQTVQLDVYDDNSGKPGTSLFGTPVNGTVPVGG